MIDFNNSFVNKILAGTGILLVGVVVYFSFGYIFGKDRIVAIFSDKIIGEWISVDDNGNVVVFENDGRLLVTDGGTGYGYWFIVDRFEKLNNSPSGVYLYENVAGSEGVYAIEDISDVKMVLLDRGGKKKFVYEKKK